jgi:hypothetical protein
LSRDHDSEDAAARAFDRVVIHRQGGLASTNFPLSEYAHEVDALQATPFTQLVTTLRAAAHEGRVSNAGGVGRHHSGEGFSGRGATANGGSGGGMHREHHGGGIGTIGVGGRSRGGTTYLGVRHLQRTGRWQAVISLCGRTVHLGFFVSEIAAARAFDCAHFSWMKWGLHPSGLFLVAVIPHLSGVSRWWNDEVATARVSSFLKHALEISEGRRAN